MAKKDKKGAESLENTENSSPVSANPSDYTYVIQNKRARRDAKHRKAITIVAIILLLLLLFVGIFYGFYTAVQINNMRVVVERSGSKVLSLSNNYTMIPGSELVELVGPDVMTHSTLAHGKSIDKYEPLEDRLADICVAEGSFTTRDDYFIAGTFYMQNVSSSDQLYAEELKFDKVTKGVEKALRIMVIRNDVITVYAAGKEVDGELVPEQVVPLQNSVYTERKLSVDEEGHYSVVVADEESADPWMTTMFYNDEYAIYNTDIPIAAGEKVKYSVVVWFEGWDPECVDDILQGEVTLTLSFAIDY